MLFERILIWSRKCIREGARSKDFEEKNIQISCDFITFAVPTITIAVLFTDMFRTQFGRLILIEIKYSSI